MWVVESFNFAFEKEKTLQLVILLITWNGAQIVCRENRLKNFLLWYSEDGSFIFEQLLKCLTV